MRMRGKLTKSGDRGVKLDPQDTARFTETDCVKTRQKENRERGTMARHRGN